MKRGEAFDLVDTEGDACQALLMASKHNKEHIETNSILFFTFLTDFAFVFRGNKDESSNFTADSKKGDFGFFQPITVNNYGYLPPSR
jgi:hypothetical protein